jgi:hypothetical protein
MGEVKKYNPVSIDTISTIKQKKKVKSIAKKADLK